MAFKQKQEKVPTPREKHNAKNEAFVNSLVNQANKAYAKKNGNKEKFSKN